MLHPLSKALVTEVVRPAPGHPRGVFSHNVHCMAVVLSHRVGGSPDIRKQSSPIGTVGCTAVAPSHGAGGPPDIRTQWLPTGTAGCTALVLNHRTGGPPVTRESPTGAVGCTAVALSHRTGWPRPRAAVAHSGGGLYQSCTEPQDGWRTTGYMSGRADHRHPRAVVG